MGERAFRIAFCLSLAIHGVALSGPLPFILRITQIQSVPVLDVRYEATAGQQIRHLREQLTQLARLIPTTSAALATTGQARITILDRSLWTAGIGHPSLPSERSTIVDLTNLVDSSGGDPVLLSYFSAVREQIQEAANRAPWLTGEGQEGIVYVAFVLMASGAVTTVKVDGSRSTAPTSLQEIAIRIVKSAAPFPPFPPSMREPSKLVVVPLEFHLSAP